jgi:hypothetical protein
MGQFEATTHPFIVRIWLEETAEEAGRATWRGYVTHVPSGERRYIHDLDEIQTFIAPYMEAMGVHVGKQRSPGRRGFLQRLFRAAGGRTDAKGGRH